jgi:hypothetical protein
VISGSTQNGTPVSLDLLIFCHIFTDFLENMAVLLQHQSMATNYRLYASTLARKLEKPYVHILFGARQTGKSVGFGYERRFACFSHPASLEPVSNPHLRRPKVKTCRKPDL